MGSVAKREKVAATSAYGGTVASLCGEVFVAAARLAVVSVAVFDFAGVVPGVKVLDMRAGFQRACVAEASRRGGGGTAGEALLFLCVPGIRGDSLLHWRA